MSNPKEFLISGSDNTQNSYLSILSQYICKQDSSYDNDIHKKLIYIPVESESQRKS